MTSAGSLAEPRAAPAILIWPSAGPAAVTRALASLAPEVVVMLPAGDEADALARALDRGNGSRLTRLPPAAGESFGSVVGTAASAVGHTDLAVVADGCLLPDGWLPRLQSAALSDDTTAAASPMLAGGGDGMFPDLPTLPGSRAEGDGHVSTPSHPRLLTLTPACAYLRHESLELIGGLDPALSHPAAALTDWAARARAYGLSCRLADDVYAEPLAGGLGPCPDTELATLQERHPWLTPAREDAAALGLGPLRRALVAARAARAGLSVTLDARCLGSGHGGTQAYTAALTAALARSGRMHVRAVVTGDGERTQLEHDVEDGALEVITYAEAVSGIARTDIVHRPQQAFDQHDLTLLGLLGERVVITQLDLIAYHDPVYHRSADVWRSYRRATRLAMAASDRVVFLSEHARRDALGENLVQSRRTAVAGIGIDPAVPRAQARRPERVPAGRPLLVMIGADYRHKNRPFALRLVQRLLQDHGWDGLLVLAGAHVPHGSSASTESALLAADPELAAHVLDLGPVDDAEKQWLLNEAQALLCPTVYEGYGLTPLEAAAAGLPCVYAPTTSLRDVLGVAAATIVPWDPVASAAAVMPLLSPGVERDRHLGRLAAALEGCRWETLVETLDGVYREALASPYRAGAPRAWEELQREQQITELAARHRDLATRVAYGMRLIDRDGLLTRAEQRGLMRVASRPWLRAPLLRPLGWLGAIGTGERRRRS